MIKDLIYHILGIWIKNAEGNWGRGRHVDDDKRNSLEWGVITDPEQFYWMEGIITHIQV